MAGWKKAIKDLAKDFGLSQVTVNRVLKRVENTYKDKAIPNYYRGNRNAFFYDKAQTEMMNLIYA